MVTELLQSVGICDDNISIILSYVLDDLRFDIPADKFSRRAYGYLTGLKDSDIIDDDIRTFVQQSPTIHLKGMRSISTKRYNLYWHELEDLLKFTTPNTCKYWTIMYDYKVRHNYNFGPHLNRVTQRMEYLNTHNLVDFVRKMWPALFTAFIQQEMPDNFEDMDHFVSILYLSDRLHLEAIPFIEEQVLPYRFKKKPGFKKVKDIFAKHLIFKTMLFYDSVKKLEPM